MTPPDDGSATIVEVRPGLICDLTFTESRLLQRVPKSQVGVTFIVMLLTTIGLCTGFVYFSFLLYSLGALKAMSRTFKVLKSQHQNTKLLL